MSSIEVNGGNVVYEILGESGDLIALTPGGRFSKEIPGLRPLAEALAAGGYRVLLWDRPNCGASDVQFYGQSESHMRAETLHKLVTGLGFERCILAGGSGGARDSMLTTMLYPELVEKLVVWNIVGGIYGSFVLGSYYIIPSILAVRGTGMDGVVKVPEWRERIEENPANEKRFLDFDSDGVPQVHAALAQRLRFQAGPDDSGRRRRNVRSNQGSHLDHSWRRERHGSPQTDIAGSQLLDQGIEADRPAVAGGRLGARFRGSRAGQSEALQHV